MSHKSLVRLLLVPCLLLAAAGCGALATPGAKPSIRIVSPANGSSLKISSSQVDTTVTVRWAVSHFTAGGSDQIRLYENGKWRAAVSANSISLSLGPGSYQFKVELVGKGKVVATSAPVVVSVNGSSGVASNAGVSVTVPSWCNTRTGLMSDRQPASTVSVRLTCLPGGDQIFRMTGFHEFYAPDSSGNLWFVVAPPSGTGVTYARLGIGRITLTGTFSVYSKGLSTSGCLSSGLYPLTPGPGGMWFGCPGVIGKIVPSGTISLFTKGLAPSAYCSTPTSCALNDLTWGRNGDILFRGYGSNNTSFIGMISPSGAVTLVPRGLQAMCPGLAEQTCLQPGPGSDMLFSVGGTTANATIGFGLITPSGSVSRFTNALYPSASCPAQPSCFMSDLTVGPGGDIWLAGSGPNNPIFIDKVSPSGTVTHFTKGLAPSALCSTFCSPSGLTLSPDGTVWFTGYASTNPAITFIGKISPSGTVTLFTKGLYPSGPCSSSCSLGHLTLSPDGAVWFSGYGPSNASYIGKISPSGTVTLFTKALCPASAASTAASCFVSDPTAGPDGAIWFLGSTSTGSAPPFIGRISPSGTVSVFSKGLPAAYELGSLSLGPTGTLSFLGFADPGHDAPTFFGQITPSTTTTPFP